MLYVGSQKYKLYVGSERRMIVVPLPYDAEVEYLESTGTQYIDTGIIPDANTGIYAKLEPSNTTDTYAIGLRDTTGDTRWCIGYSNFGWYWGYGTYLSSHDRITSFNVDAKLNWLADGELIVTDGTNTKTYALPSLSFTPSNNIRLFGSAGVSASYSVWSGKIYGVQISQGSNIIMSLIPARVGQVGYMYDKVSGQLFGNSGTGSFTIGNDVN